MIAVEPTAARTAGLLAASLLLHAAMVALLGRAPIKPAAPPQRPLQVAVVDKPPPLPPPPAPVPMKVTRAPRRPAQDLPPPIRIQPPPPTSAPPPPSREAAETTQPVVLPGITLESTSQGGSFAVSSGNTLHGQPPSTAPDPQEAKPYKADTYVAASQAHELPSVASRPDSLRDFYPEVARRRGVQGEVVLRLLIDGDGSVAKIDILSEPGEGLGPAGARAIRERFRFNPGKVNGRPVATTITFKVRFTLE